MKGAGIFIFYLGVIVVNLFNGYFMKYEVE